MSHVRHLIENNASWLEILQTEYKIHVIHDAEAALVSLKYNQLESPMHSPLVQECRGMVVDISKSPRIVAHPYNKFWNLGEAQAAPIDWSTARVQEKLDGSLMILYFHHGHEKWYVASSGTPTAGGSFGDSQETFREGFWRNFHALDMRLPEWSGGGYNRMPYHSWCFMFELCATENRVVVRHDKPRIVLHGARVLDDGHEVSRMVLEQVAREHNWEIVKEYPLTTVDQVMAAVDALDPIQTEGFVVVDDAFNRVKIKSPRYVILHHMKGDATPRRAIELWQTGEAGELLAHFPEMAPAILPVHDLLNKAAEDALATFLKNASLPTRKEFAMAVKDDPGAAAIFLLLKHDKPTLEVTKEIMRGQSLASLERLLDRLTMIEIVSTV